MSNEPEIAPRRHRDTDAEMDITPMIDITFLLLAFFVVVSKMDPKRNVEMPVSEVAAKYPEKSCVMIYVDYEGDVSPTVDATVFIGKKGDIPVQGSPEEQSEQITQYVEGELAQNPELQYIMIKAHGDSKNGQIERIKSAAAKASGERQLLVGVENKRVRR
jgi:biopolymer transport protein TolR